MIQISDDFLWKDIPGFNDYQAHPGGEVRVKSTKRILQAESKKHRYRITQLKGKSVAIHRLIALTFCPNPLNLPQVNHKDGNKRNNSVDNLEWISASDNVKHAIKLGRKDGKPAANPIRITLRDGSFKDYNSTIKAAEEMNIERYLITYCLKTDGYYTGIPGKKSKEDSWIWKVERITQSINNTNTNEKQIEIDGFTHLTACSNGIIKNKNTNKSVGTSDGRYIRVKPSTKGDKLPGRSAHQLIALTFIPNPDNKPYVNHIDGNTHNNSVSNLEWCTQKENMAHAKDNGLINDISNKAKSDKMKIPVYQLELNGNIIKKFESVSDANTEIGSNISSVCTGYNKNNGRNLAYGYGWCFVRDYSSPRINKIFLELFPELIERDDILFDKIRPYIIKGSRPIWQIDIDGRRIKLWDSIADVSILAAKSNIHSARMSDGKKLAGGYFWKYASYDDILNDEI